MAHGRLLQACLGLALANVCLAGALASADEKCTPLMRLRVKSDWTASYGSGRDRSSFSLAVFNTFLKANPDERNLFSGVNGNDTRSPEFTAHMARVLGGVDAIISVLNEEDVLKQILKHYSKFHTYYGSLPYEEFGEAIGRVISKGLHQSFDAKAWQICFRMIGEYMGEDAHIRQSPIDLERSYTEFDPTLRVPWIINYIPENVKTLTNNGHSVQVAINYKGTELSGGPLGKKKFCLEQFHFHWGSTNNQGSEHTVEGYAYPAELHLVHWNCERYASFKDAIPSEDGLVVLGVFIQVDDKKFNPILKYLTDQFGSIEYKGDTVDLTPFNPKDLLPSDINSYWNYPGSLTTPPYSQTVNWVVFEHPIYFTQDMLNKFRHLNNYAKGEEASSGHDGHHGPGHIVDNYRKPQRLFGRKIKSSHH